jgi:hypothetical protein
MTYGISPGWYRPGKFLQDQVAFGLIHTEKLRNPAEEMHSFVGIADTAE